jgi:hypothetical protein
VEAFALFRADSPPNTESPWFIAAIRLEYTRHLQNERIWASRFEVGIAFASETWPRHGKAIALSLLDDDRNPDDGFYTIKFHRLFGDADGSAAVDFTDLAILALPWLDGPGDTGLDSNDDNILNFSDLAALVQNWLSVNFRTFQAANFNGL